MKNFMKELRSPKPGARGLTRWWWYGAAVKKEEIVEQLDEMASNGIGGVEIQMLYPLSMETDDRKCIAYFSPEYFDILEFTKRETEKRGMIFDLTLGTSWPFGGPFVPPNLSAPHVTTYTIDGDWPKGYFQALEFCCERETGRNGNAKAPELAGDTRAYVLLW